MDSAALVMAGCLAAMVLLAYSRDSSLPLEGFRRATSLFQEVWLPLLLGFAIAGMFEVLVPRDLVVRWMSEESGLRGILVGWAVGLCLPGGPYVVFPLAASFVKQGIGVGPLIAFVTAKLLLSPLRTVSWELPFLGGAFVVARNLPSLFVPPLVGILGQALYDLLARK